MFDRHLPAGLYENLPRIHLATAVLVAALPLSPVRWVAVVALALAGWLTVQRRRRHRSRRPGRQAGR
jgi:Flp pilus assembly protein TadB